MSVAVCIIVLLFTLISGFPIGICIGISGMAGLVAREGISAAFLNVGNIAFNTTYSYTLLAIAGFVLMGEVFVAHGVGMDLYDTAQKWVGRVKGGLGLSSTVMGAAFGFMCGPASNLTIGDVDAPGEVALYAALEMWGDTPAIIRTASGKHHLYYRHNGEGRHVRFLGRDEHAWRDTG